MKVKKRQIVFWIAAVLAVCLYLYGRYRMQGLEERMRTISFVKTGEGSLLLPQNKKNMPGVFWTELEDRQIQSEVLEKNVTANVIALHGRSDILFPNMPVIDTESEKHCLVSETLAYELFGGTDVKGLPVIYQGNVYQVKGVLERKERLFVYEPSEKEMIPYNRLTVINPEDKAINVVEQELQMKYSSGRVLDYTVPKLFFELCFLTNMEFPKDMIPEKWSDFDFWSRRFQEKKEALDFLIRIQKTSIDIEIREEFMFMKRLLCVLLVMVLVCTGCAPAGKKEEKPGTKEKEDAICLYSLEDNDSLWQAARWFENKYPEYKIHVEIGVTGEDGVTISDAIRNLNTEVMAGNGPDIIFLDGLPIEDYIEKGVLADLSDVIEHIEESGEVFFENVLSAYQKKDKVYAIPTFFSVPIIMGDEWAVQAKDTHHLVEMISEKADDEIPVINGIGGIPLLFLTSFKELFPEKQGIDQEALTVFLKDMKQIAEVSEFEKDMPEYEIFPPFEGMVESYPSYEGSGGENILWKETQMEIETISFAQSCAIMKSIDAEIGLSYQYLNAQNGKMFLAEKVVGINASSRHMEGAKKFLEYYLSDETMGNEEFHAGISVNRTSFEKSMPVSEEKEWFTIFYQDMKAENGVYIRALSSQEAQEFLQFLDGADTLANIDRTVFEIVLMEMKKYIYEEESLEDTVDAIAEKIEIYLAE